MLDKASLHKTIVGTNFYALDRSFLEFINNRLHDFGVSDASALPYFENVHKKEAMLEVLAMYNYLNTLCKLAFEVEAHKAALAQAETSKHGLPPAQQAYHRAFIE